MNHILKRLTKGWKCSQGDWKSSISHSGFAIAAGEFAKAHKKQYPESTITIGGARINPGYRPIIKQRYYNHAVQAAKWLYHHFKGRGVPSWVIERVSPKIRPIVVNILRYNGVPVTYANPPKGLFK